MNRTNYYGPFMILLPVLLSLAILTGCAGHSQTSPVSSGVPVAGRQELLKMQVDDLIQDLLAGRRYGADALAPAAVMPGSLREGKPPNRLAEFVMERLELRLAEDRDLHTLRRQAWFEFRESRPLTFRGYPAAERNYLRALVIYEVRVSPDPLMNEALIRITGHDADGRTLPGVLASREVDFGPDSPARRLYQAASDPSRFPEGLEERPYRSLDRLAYSLAANLSDAYNQGLPAGGGTAASSEVQVFLFSKPAADLTLSRLQTPVQQALQQALVREAGFTCVAGETDLLPIFQQIDFYQSNAAFFEVEHERLSAGTILLLAEVNRHRMPDRVGVAVRAVWRISPLEGPNGQLLQEPSAGTYVSGFAAKAYVYSNSIPKARPEFSTTSNRPAVRPESASVETQPSASPSRIKPSPQPPRASSQRPRKLPGAGLDVCFHDFTEVLERRIEPVLKQAPGVTGVQRAYHACDQAPSCICYSVSYTGSIHELQAWIRGRLRTSQVVPFRMEDKGDGRLDIYFDGGFR